MPVFCCYRDHSVPRGGRNFNNEQSLRELVEEPVAMKMVQVKRGCGHRRWASDGVGLQGREDEG